jgi:hypothetical protein
MLSPDRGVDRLIFVYELNLINRYQRCAAHVRQALGARIMFLQRQLCDALNLAPIPAISSLLKRNRSHPARSPQDRRHLERDQSSGCR